MHTVKAQIFHRNRRTGRIYFGARMWHTFSLFCVIRQTSFVEVVMRVNHVKPPYEAKALERSNERNAELKQMQRLQVMLARKLELRRLPSFAESPAKVA